MASSLLGESIRAARERLGWSRETLSHHSGLSWAAIAQIETGRRRDVRITSLAALANALGASMDQLARVPTPGAPSRLGHRGLLYRSEEEFLAGTVPFLTGGVERSERVLTVLPHARSELLRDALGDAAGEIRFEDASPWYGTPVDAIGRYREYTNEQLAGGALRIRVVAEIVLQGGSRAEVDTWAKYEAFLNVVFAPIPATFCCAYDADTSPRRVVDHMHRTHPELATGDAGTANPRYESPEQVLLAR